MKNKWRLLKILVTVILLGFLLSFSLKRFARKNLTDITVNLKQTPVYFIDEKDITEIVKQYNPTHKVGDIDIPSLEKKLNNLPGIDSANVYLNLNGTLNVDIKQRLPVFRLLKDGKDFYVDGKGVAFPTFSTYSYPCMLVSGNVKPEEYKKVAELVTLIGKDDFSKKYFIGITKSKDNYQLLTTDGNYKVELGDLDNLPFKLAGFKAFVKKYLIYQDLGKYSKISMKFDNQIVTTLNPDYQANDSIIDAGRKELEKIPELVKKKEEAISGKHEKKKEIKTPTPEKKKDKSSAESKKSNDKKNR